MAALKRLAHFKGRRDEVPNQQLAHDLAAKKDRAGIREIAANLSNPDRDIQADCIKVLYEVGYIDPTLIADYAGDFLGLLKSRNNRMVWGGMIALATVAGLKPDLVFEHRDEIEKAMEEGSVITIDNGVLALARAAAKDDRYNRAVFPYLLNHLKTCEPKQLAQHAEKMLEAVNPSNRLQFAAVLTRRMKDLSGSTVARLEKVLRRAEGI